MTHGRALVAATLFPEAPPPVLFGPRWSGPEMVAVAVVFAAILGLVLRVWIAGREHDKS
jgi:hypothetical protein